MDALRRRWLAILGTGIGLAVLGGLLGHWITPHKVEVVMILRESFEPGLQGGSFKPHELSPETLVEMLSSKALAARVGEKLQPRLSPDDILDRLTVHHQASAPEKATLAFEGGDPQKLVELANLYAREAVAMTQEEQLEEGRWLAAFYGKKLAETDAKLQEANAGLMIFQEQEGLIDPDAETQAFVKVQGEFLLDYERSRMELQLINQRIALASQTTGNDKVRAAREKLDELRTRFTDAHPEVQAQIKVIEALQGQASASGNPQITDLQNQRKLIESRLTGLEQSRASLQQKLTGLSQSRQRYASVKASLDSLQKSRDQLEGRRREIALNEEHAQGFYRIHSSARLEDATPAARYAKCAAFAGVFGVILAVLVVLIVEVLDDRLKTADDIRRITGLPVLATLGDLNNMTPEEREKWAFRAWTILSGKLSKSANHGLVCGFISANHGEGRSTWVKLLINAASQRGLRVLTVSADHAYSQPLMSEVFPAEEGKGFAKALPETGVGLPVTAASETPGIVPAPDALAFPAEVTQQLANPELPAVVHMPLPGWVWNLERRQQWQSALAHWRGIDNVVILLELPPASVSESILLAENIPQLIWLVGSGQARARETRMHLETLRHARCRLAGAVLNHEQTS